MKIITLSLMLFCAILVIAPCAAGQKVVEANAASASALVGKLDGRTYRNDVLHFEIKLPDDGVILNQAEIDVYRNAGVDQLKSGNAKTDQAIESAANRELILLNYATKPVGSPGNAILVVGTGKQNPGVTAPMVIAATLKTLTASGRFELIRSLSGVDIGGIKADGMDLVMTTVNGAKIKERLFVMIRNGYSLSFALCGADDEQVTAAWELLKAVKFVTK